MYKTLIAVALAFGIVLTLATNSVTAALPDSSGSILLLLSESNLPGAVTPEAHLAPILKSLQAKHHLTKYEWLADANAFRVEGADATATQIFLTLRDVARVTPLRDEILDAARQQKALQIKNAQRAQAARTQHLERAANTPFFSVHETWDMFQAKGLTAGQAVTAVLKDSGANTKDTLNVNADGDGNIWAWFGADAVQGDFVDVTYDATTVTIHSDVITIDFDFTNNVILGTAGANRTLYINVRDDGIGWCEQHEYNTSVQSNGEGEYEVEMEDNYDVIRRTEVDVMSETEQGIGGWAVWRHAPWLVVQTMPNATNGKGNGLAADQDVEIILKTGATEKASTTSHTNYPDAGFGFGLGGTDMLPGDTLTATENNNTWATIPIVSLTTRLNSATGQVTGSAPANKQVVIRTDHFNRATGGWESSCQTATANGSGTYSATAPTPFIGNDSVTTFYADGDGFEQQVWDVAPFLNMHIGTNLLEGSFKTGFDGEMNITVQNKKGITKFQGKSYAFAGWWSEFLAKDGKPVNLAAGDAITIKPSAGAFNVEAGKTLTGTVTKLTLALDLANNKVTGTAPKNAHVALSPQKWYGYGFECRDECWRDAVANGSGAFEYTFNADLVTGDFAEVHYVDAKGNITHQQAYSTTPAITLDSFPPTFRRGRTNEVKYTIANGMHVDDTSIFWDSSSRPDWNYTIQNGVEGNWWPGGPGQYSVNVWIAHQGKIYFRAMARVDGRWIFTTPEDRKSVV